MHVCQNVYFINKKIEFLARTLNAKTVLQMFMQSTTANALKLRQKKQTTVQHLHAKMINMSTPRMAKQFMIKLIKLSALNVSFYLFHILRVNIRKNQSLSKGSVSRGPSIWLIFTYIVQFFTLILVMLFVFHKNYCIQDYGSLKF